MDGSGGDLRDGENREIKACPNCGSPKLKIPPTQVDAWVGAAAVDGRYYCETCGFEGLPILFDNKEDYGEFLKLRIDSPQVLDSSNPAARAGDTTQSVKRPGFSFILSLFLPGLGHFYAGYKKRGAVAFIIYFSANLANSQYMGLPPSFGVVAWTLNLVIAVDAYIKTRKDIEKPVLKAGME